MNEREKKFLDLLLNVGIALVDEGRKCNVDSDAVHSIVFSLEDGYVDAYIVKDGKQYHASRFDQFPEVSYRGV